MLDVRLTNSNQNEGKLTVYHNNSWKVVCGKHWTLTESSVICTKLGYSNVVDFKILPLNTSFKTSLEYLNMRINCSEKESLFHECFNKNDTQLRCDAGSVHIRCAGNERGKKSI